MPALAPAISTPPTNTPGDRENPAIAMPAAARRPALTAVRRAWARAIVPVSAVAAR